MPNSNDPNPNGASNSNKGGSEDMDSISFPKNRIVDIQTEYSQIVGVLAKPLPQPKDAEDSEIRNGISVERNRQLAQRDRFIRRYQTAILAFLGKKLGNNQKVDEVWDLFLEKFLLGGLSNYSPELGSFRIYLKTVLRRTCYEYARKNAKVGEVQLETAFGPVVDGNDFEADQAFNEKLIESIFVNALESIRQVDTLFYIALKAHTQAIARNVKPPSSENLASVLSAESGSVISKENARQIKSRASKLFAKKLIEEVMALIRTENLDEVEAALIDIGILKYCKKALAKLRRGS